MRGHATHFPPFFKEGMPESIAKRYHQAGVVDPRPRYFTLSAGEGRGEVTGSASPS